MDDNKKQNLRLVFQEGDLPGLHPHQNITHIRCVGVNKLLFESLTRIDRNQKTVLAGALSFDVSEDMTEYTFTLRDATWSNKELVTAYDYENAWKNAVSPNSACVRADLFDIIENAKEIRSGEKIINDFGAKAIDDKTLKVKLIHSYPEFLELVASSVFAPVRELNIFNGPFIVGEWNKEKSLILEKNPMYWDKEEVHLNTIEINFVKEISTGFSLFKDQKIDWIGSPISFILPEDVNKTDSRRKLSDFILWAHINTKLSHLQSKNIRKSFSYAIDRKFINETILFGGDPISFLPTSMAPFEQSFEYNLEKAKHYFEAGLQELQISHSDFPEIRLGYFNRPEMIALAKYLEKTLKDNLNIPIKLVENNWNDFRKSQERGDFDIAVCYESSLFPGPFDLLQLIEEKQNWNKQSYQKALQFAKSSKDNVQKTIFLKEALEALSEEMPVIALSNQNEVFSVNPHLQGYYFDSANSVDFTRAYFV